MRIGRPLFTAPAPHYILVCDQKTSGTQGGSSIAGTQTRTINTKLVDTGNLCTLASNRITLLAGTYQYHIKAPAGGVGSHQCWLFNFSDGVIVAGACSSEYNFPTSYVQSTAHAIGRFTITASKTFEIRHYTESAIATNGLGTNSGSGNSEVYTIAEFWREPI